MATTTTTTTTTQHPPPPPSGQALHLVSALTNPEPAHVHQQALRARDEALSASLESYNQLCLQLSLILAGVASMQDAASSIMARMDQRELEHWKQQDPQTTAQLQSDISRWIPFGQMAGLVLKNALLRPPPALPVAIGSTPTSFSSTMALEGTIAEQVKGTLLFALASPHAALRAVASSVIAATAVTPPGRMVQPSLHVRQWQSLVPTLISHIQRALHQQQQQQQHSTSHAAGPAVSSSNNILPLLEGSLATIQKLMEDGPTQLSTSDIDTLIPVLLAVLHQQNNHHATATPTHAVVADIATLVTVPALKSLASCLSMPILPNALVLHFGDYLGTLSALAATSSHNISGAGAGSSRTRVRQCVCQSIVTVLERRSEYLAPHFASVAQFMLQCTAEAATQPDVALAACEFWLALAHLDEEAMTADMVEVLECALLPSLLPILLQNMVYTAEQRTQLLARNEVDLLAGGTSSNMKPVFHRSRAGGSSSHRTSSHEENDDDDDDDDDDDGYDEDDEGDFDFDNDEEGNQWTLRTCAAAALDSLTNLCGAAAVLPTMQPCLEQGLSSANPWVQEASILALGAMAEGCREEMQQHMTQLHPYLLQHLAMPEQAPQQSAGTETTAAALPQLKSIAAWTLGRYASWVVEQVQTGTQGHLLAQMSQVFLERLTQDCNRRVQISVASGFGVLVEVAGDLMVPYLPEVYRGLVDSLSRYQGRSLVLLLDVMGTLAECCGPAIAEEPLPSLYVPPMLHMMDTLAKQDPSDRVLLPLMEALASTAMTSGVNFRPYALECFENAMCVIESMQLALATAGDGMIENEEDADPIVCSADLLDGLVEGLRGEFPALVSSSARYGQHFLSVVIALCEHEIAGVRMSALALVGDLARHAPILLEPALPQILAQALQSMDPIQPSVCTNAVWAVGEICVRCQGHAQALEPFAPALVQNLVAMLMGNGQGLIGGNVSRAAVDNAPRLMENAAACMGRLAKVSPQFVAADLPRFLLGWCEGLAKIWDSTERRDAFEGFIQAMYANPQALQQVQTSITDAMSSILFCIVAAWHMPTEELHDRSADTLRAGNYEFRPFPAQESALGATIVQLVRDMKTSAGEEQWNIVQKSLPVNMRQFLRQSYQL